MPSKFSPELMDRILQASKIPQTPVSLKQMVQFGRKPSPQVLFRGGEFLKYELPIRLAHRVIELSNLPHELSKMPSVVKVRDWYSQSFQELVALQKGNEPNPATYYSTDTCDLDASALTRSNLEFIKVIDKIKKRHAPTTQKIATGVMELKQHWRKNNSPLYPGSFNDAGKFLILYQGSPILPLPTAIQSFLDNFYMSRIGIRMLIGQHIAVSQVDQPTDYVGIICTKTRYS
jgi:pyruvate dehydrogenase kinase 2/3/4